MQSMMDGRWRGDGDREASTARMMSEKNLRRQRIRRGEGEKKRERGEMERARYREGDDEESEPGERIERAGGGGCWPRRENEKKGRRRSPERKTRSDIHPPGQLDDTCRGGVA